MKSILYIQNETSTGKGSIIVDGKHCEDKNERETAFNELYEANDNWMEIIPNRFYRSEKGIYLSSNYKNVDVVGRKIVFAFCTDSIDIDEACNVLTKISKEVVGYDCFNNEIFTWRNRKKNLDKSAYMLFEDNLIDRNGNVISKDSPDYQNMFNRLNQQSGNGKNEKKHTNGTFYGKEVNLLIADLFYPNRYIPKTMETGLSDGKMYSRQTDNIDKLETEIQNFFKYFGKKFTVQIFK